MGNPRHEYYVVSIDYVVPGFFPAEYQDPSFLTEDLNAYMHGGNSVLKYACTGKECFVLNSDNDVIGKIRIGKSLSYRDEHWSKVVDFIVTTIIADMNKYVVSKNGKIKLKITKTEIQKLIDKATMGREAPVKGIMTAVAKEFRRRGFEAYVERKNTGTGKRIIVLI